MTREDDGDPPALSRRRTTADPVSAVNNAPDPVLTIDDGLVTFASAAVDSVLGYAPTELVGEPVARVLPDAFADRLADFLERSPADGPATFEWSGYATAAEGRRRAITVSVRRHGPDSDRVTAIVHSETGAEADDPVTGDGTVPDRRGGRLVARLAGYAVVALDRDGSIRSWDGGGDALAGWDADGVVGTHVSTFRPDRQNAQMGGTVDFEALLEAACSDGRAEARGWLTRADGSLFWASITVTAVRDADGPVVGYRGVVRDCTERKRTAEERQLLVDLSQAIADAETFEDAIRLALEAVCNRTEWVYAEAWAPPDGSAEGAPGSLEAAPPDDAGEPLLERVATYAADPEFDAFRAASDAWTFHPNEGLPGRVWATGDPEWLPTTADAPVEVFDRAEPAGQVGPGAALGVPITAGGQTVAVLTFFLRERREIDDQLAEIVTAIATELGEQVAHKHDEARLDRERELLARVFEVSPVGLLLLSDDGEVRRANGRTEEIVGAPTESIASRRFADLPGELYDATGDPVAAADLPPRRVLTTGSTVDDVEYRLDREDGVTVWLSISAAPIRTDGEAVGGVIVVLDEITSLKQRERSLRSFREAIEQAGHSIYVTDTDATIEYVNPAFEEITGYTADEVLGETPAILSSGHHDEAFYEDLWETILDGDVWTGEVVNRRKSGERYVVDQTIAPVTGDAGEIERFVAINTDVTARNRRQHRLERQRDRLARLHQLMATMWEVTQALVTASTESELETNVCEALVSAGFCEVAWIGAYDRGTEVLRPSACAGVDEDALETVPIGDAPDDRELPCGAAVERCEVVVSRPEGDGGVVAPWRNDDPRQGYHAAAAIPLLHGDLLFGTLTLYSDRPRAFDGEEREHMDELGDAVANGLDTVKTRKLLHADQVIELELRSRDERSFLVAASVGIDTTFSLAGTAPLSDGRTLLYVRLGDRAVDELRDLAADRDGVGDLRIVSEDGRGVRVAVPVRSGASVAKRLIDCGARVVDATADEGAATILAHVTPDHDVRSIVDEVRTEFPALELVAKRERERPSSPYRSILAELSDRQRASLYAAYHAGYFRWPRESTAEEVATAMDVSGPTLHKHLRRAEQRVLGALLDADRGD